MAVANRASHVESRNTKITHENSCQFGRKPLLETENKSVAKSLLETENKSVLRLSRSSRSPNRRSDPAARMHSNRSDSPRRMIRPESHQLKKELAPRTVNIRDKSKRIGHDSLKNIADLKSGIAEMRPSGTKIRWNTSQSPRASCPTRISGLDLQDLSFHGCIPRAANEATEKEKAEIEIGRLENHMRKCLTSIEKVNKDVEKDKQDGGKLRAINQELRQEIVGMPAPRNQSIRQAQKQLESNIKLLSKNIADVEKQVIFLDWQRQRIEIESEEILISARKWRSRGRT
jgi:hypothetical protein